MALVNPNIAMSYRGIELPQQNALADYAAIQQIQGGRQAQELNALKIQEAQRAEAKDISRTNALAQAGTDDTAIANALLKSGDLKGYSDFLKSRTEQSSASTKLLTDKLALLPNAYKMADTPEAYLALHQSVHTDPVLGPWLKSVGATPEKGLATLQNAVQTGKFDELRMGSMQSVSQLLEGMKPVVVSPGASVFQGGKSVFTAPAAPKQTDLQLNYQAAKNQGFVGSIFDYEKKLKEAGRPPAQPVQPVAPTITSIVDPLNPNQMITIDARRYQGGGAGSPGVIGVAGKEPGAALRQNKVEAGKTQLADDLDNLRASFQTLDTMRAIPSTERGALSNVASGIAATGIGQRTGQLFGTEAQVERDVISSARMRLVNSIKNATGMSAQQLNSNVELQTMLKSISDPGQSVQAALRIIDDIEDAYVKGDGKMLKRKPPPAAAGVDTSNPLLQVSP